jgi:hypothetical protein
VQYRLCSSRRVQPLPVDAPAWSLAERMFAGSWACEFRSIEEASVAEVLWQAGLVVRLEHLPGPRRVRYTLSQAGAAAVRDRVYGPVLPVQNLR